jgi:hypothetical protein
VTLYHSIAEADKALAADMGELADDPLEWVRFSFPWRRGQLVDWDGPDSWQEGYLREWGEGIRLRQFDGKTPVMPYMTSTTSGHGVGKSALVGWASNFIMSTRPMSKGIVTANSIPQLETKTWAEISKWAKLCITRRWFRITSGRGSLKMVSVTHPEQWRLDGMAWDEHRAAAFAGLHAATASPFYIFDEASEIARIILETAQGGLTDGEPFMLLFSNPTKAAGYFFDTHHEMKHRFKVYKIDSRSARTTNKQLIQQWIEDYGLDSDYVKVRVLGEFPMTGDRQFIPTNLVTAAMDINLEPQCTPTDPVIIGVDPARFGDDEATIYVRRGRDARSEPPQHHRGLDNVQLAFKVKELNDRLLADAINIDAGNGSGVIDTLRNWGVPNVNEIHFGGKSPDAEYDNMATYMMGEVRKWLKQFGVTIPIDVKLKGQLTARKYDMVESQKGTAVRIESKDDMKTDKDIGESPDRADGLGLTFAVPVAMRDIEKTRAAMSGLPYSNVVGVEYDRFAN